MDHDLRAEAKLFARRGRERHAAQRFGEGREGLIVLRLAVNAGRGKDQGRGALPGGGDLRR